MIHIITSHHNTEEFILPQIHFLKQNLKQEYKIWAYFDPEDKSKIKKYKDYFYFLEYPPSLIQIIKQGGTSKDITYKNEPGSLDAHYLKLDHLTSKVITDENTDDNDILLFLDGDSFPIAPIDDFIEEKLKRYELCAIQRLENGFDLQPHGSFTLTTVELFKRIKPSWSPGFSWVNDFLSVRTDVGGEILRKLIEHRIDWFPLRRSNKQNIHPVCFGVYDDLIYHHGAGFRGKIDGFTLKHRPNQNTEEMYEQARILEDRMSKLETFYDVLL